MTTALTRLSGSAFELTLTVPWADVKAVYDHVFDELAAEIEIEGFRKGKAPKEAVAAKLDKGKIYGEVVNHLLPEAYSKALAEHNLKPVMAPKVQVTSAEEDKEWQFIVRAAEKPTIELGNYQEAIKAANAKGLIWTPDKAADAKTEADPKNEQEAKNKKLSAVIDLLISTVKVDIADILIEAETNRLLTALLEDVRQAGLTYEQYLQSSGQTAEAVREKYKNQALTTLKLEFILEAVADDLKTQVSEEEISAIIAKETDEEKKKALTEQSYLLASVLRREKTLTQLLSL